MQGYTFVKCKDEKEGMKMREIINSNSTGMLCHSALMHATPEPVQRYRVSAACCWFAACCDPD
jgi:hypothetical protein